MAVHTCTNETEFTTAISAAVYGDEIRLTAGTTFTAPSGSWTFGPKNGYVDLATTNILVTTTATIGLPGVSTRTGPTYASLLPKLRSRQLSSFQNNPCLYVTQGAKGWKFRHLEVQQTYFGSGTMFRVGNSDDTQYLKSQQPRDIHIDRLYFNTLPNPYWGQRRYGEAHGVNITVTNCYGEPFGCPTNSSEAVGWWFCNGEGPLTWTNNWLNGGTHCLMSGGGHATIRTISQVQASPAPTASSAKVSWATSAHPDSDPPVVGDHISVIVQGGTIARHALVTSYTAATSNSGTIGFTYALENNAVVTDIPDIPGEIRWGVIPTGITIQRNRMTKPSEWAGANILPIPTTPAAVAQSSGTLVAGTYNFRVAAKVTSGFQGTAIFSTATTVIPVVVNGSQRISASWDAVSGADMYRAWFQFPDLTWRYVETASTSTLFSSPATGTASASGPPTGQRWHVKNVMELKVGIDVDISYNIFSNCGTGSGQGYALWMKSLNQPTANASTFNLTRDVDIHHNIIRNTIGVLSTSAREIETSNQSKRPGQMDNFSFRHNLCYNTAIEPWAEGVTSNWGMSLTGGKNNTLDHNTVIHTQKAALRLIVQPERQNYISPNLIITNNLLIRNSDGVRGQSGLNQTEGIGSLDSYSLSSYSYTNNALAGGSSGSYPAGVGNLFPSVGAFQAYFTDYANLDFSLAPGSPAIGAGTGGSDLGADVADVLAGTATVLAGTPLVGPPPVITTPSPLPDAVEDVVFGPISFQAVDGDQPFVWSLDSGTLPTGLSLDPSGVLSGTPTVLGLFSFVIKVTDDGAITATKAFTQTIVSADPDIPQRFYFQINQAAYSTGLSVSSGWNSGGPVAGRRFLAMSTKQGSTLTNLTRIGSGVNPGFVCILQYVTYKLVSQEIRGNITGVLSCNENNPALNCTVAVCVRVIDVLGNEVAVLTNGGDATPVAPENTATTPPEFHAGTQGVSNRPRVFITSLGVTDIPLTPYLCADEDRVCIEIGYRHTGTNVSQSGGFMVGDSGATDMVDADSSTINITENGWVEFTRELVEFVPPPPDIEPVVQVPAPSAYQYRYALQYHHIHRPQEDE